VKIVLDRDALAPALARAVPLVPRGSNVPAIGCVKLDIGPTGVVITVSNFDSWYIEVVDSEPRDTWAGLVEADRLQPFIKSLSSGSSVELTTDDKFLTIAGAGAKAKLLTLPVDEFPVHRIGSSAVPVTFDVDAGALLAALKFVEPTAADEKNPSYYLRGVYLDPEGQVVTTDGHRMSLGRLASSLPAFDGVILPLATVKLLTGSLLRGFTDDTVTVSITPSLMTLTAGAWTLVSKLVAGTFPSWKYVIAGRIGTPIVVERKALQVATARIIDICRGPRLAAAQLRLYGGELLVSGRTDGGNADIENRVAIVSAPQECRFSLAATYLADALEVIEAERVELYVTDKRQLAVWVCGAGEPEAGITLMQQRE